MLNFEKIENNIVAALLTIAWAATKDRSVSQEEIQSIYKNMGGK